MVYVDANRVFVAMMQTSPTMRNNGGIQDYAGFFYVALIDPIAGSVAW